MLAILGALFLASAPAVPARPPASSACADDRGVDRCNAERQDRTRELFDLRAVEAHQTAGDRVRRVFYVDGYGRDLVAIAFVRPRGRDPVVRVHFPPSRTGERPAPHEAPVPRAVWETMIERSDNFERDLAPRIGEDRSATICMHSWVYTIEATDPALPGFRTAQLRRKVADACGGGPGAIYARDVARAAVPLLPHCAVLDIAKHRNEASLLAACAILKGDRMAAAEVLNAASAFQGIQKVDHAARLAGVFDYAAKIDWNGEQNKGSGSAATFWASELAKSSSGTSFSYGSVEGESADRIRLLATLSRSVEAEDGKTTAYEQAEVEQIWTRDQGDDLQVQSAKVGPWVRIPRG